MTDDTTYDPSDDMHTESSQRQQQGRKRDNSTDMTREGNRNPNTDQDNEEQGDKPVSRE